MAINLGANQHTCHGEARSRYRIAYALQFMFHTFLEWKNQLEIIKTIRHLGLERSNLFNLYRHVVDRTIDGAQQSLRFDMIQAFRHSGKARCLLRGNDQCCLGKPTMPRLCFDGFAVVP